MSPHFLSEGEQGGSVPRASGDEPGLILSFFVFVLVFPARAGMSPTERKPIQMATSVPRASGDEPIRAAVSM